MTAAAILLCVVVAVVAMDITIKRVYRFRKRPHESTPAAFGMSYEEIRIPTGNNRRLYGW